MKAVIEPGLLRGAVDVPSSKSCAHRLLICAALAQGETTVGMNALSEDITATAGCLASLGARVERCPQGYRVRSGPTETACTLDCGESGSTLRFLLPVAAALGARARFTGRGRLPERPNAPLLSALRAHGVAAEGELLPLTIGGRLSGGEYPIAGNISSQYITGLLLALPLCEGDSRVTLITPLESAAYVDITLDCLRAFGIRVLPDAAGYTVPGGQRFRSPGRVTAEGDWSAAAFWRAANALGGRVECRGLNAASLQGDRAIDGQLQSLGGEINVSNTPDLVPALAAAAALYPGETRITGAARLRLKESDRLRAVSAMLRALGGDCDEEPDGLTIRGVPALRGGHVDGMNDHRIVMAAAIAASAARGEVVIDGCEAVNKSYPAFFEHFNALGGNARVESIG